MSKLWGARFDKKSDPWLINLPSALAMTIVWLNMM